MEDKDNNLNNEKKTGAGSISDMLKNAATQQPPATPNKPLPPSNPFKKASKVIARADSKKNPQVKKNVVAGKAKAPTKKKSMAVGILAFLLAGGAVFVMMIMMGTKDIKNQDARMNFSYGNVIAGAVAPLFEALGITTEDSTIRKEAIASRKAARLSKYGELNIDDWLGIKPISVADVKNSQFGKGSYGGNSGRSPSAGTPTHIEKMDSGFSGGFSSGGGGGSSSSASRDGNSFAQSSVKDAINKNGDGSDAAARKYSLKGGKDNVLRSLRAARQTMGDGLASGSASVARGNVASVYGQGKAKLANSGKATGFSNGKLAQGAFNDANAVALDRIESGDIMNLKMSDIDGKNASVPSASMPEKVNSGVDDTKDDEPADSLARLALSSAGDAFGTAVSGDSSSSSSSESNSNNVPDAVREIGDSEAWDEVEYKIEDDYPCGGTTAEPVYCQMYNTSKPTYVKTKKGTWTVVYKGEQIQRDKNGNIIDRFEYSEAYVIVPGGNPKMQALNSLSKPQNGQWQIDQGFAD